MAKKEAVRDTGIVALVPADIPRPLPASKGRGRVAIIPGSVAIHAGETEADALAFAASLRDSFARYQEAHPALPATGHDMTMRGTDAKTGKPVPLAPIPPTPPRVGPVYRSRLSDGLAEHRCDATAGKVRVKYLIQPERGSRAYCVACVPDREPVKGIPVKCAECDATSYHGRYSYSAAESHEYRPVPVVTADTVTPLDIIDVPRIIPADLCEPYGRNVPRSGPPPRVVPAPVPPEPTRKARATRKATDKAPAKTTVPAAPRIVPIVQPEPARKAERGHRPAACERCGRADFKTDKGRAWHVENNPECAKYARADRHAYVALAS